jgi:hypothetical protein
LAGVGVSVAAGGLLIGNTISQDKDNVATDDLSKLPPTGTSNTTLLDMTGLGSVPTSPPNMRVTGDAGGTLVPTVTMSTTEDNYELVQEATDEYMESDDAWLNAIAEIAAEEEEEGEEEDDKDSNR